MQIACFLPYLPGRVLLFSSWRGGRIRDEPESKHHYGGSIRLSEHEHVCSSVIQHRFLSRRNEAESASGLRSAIFEIDSIILILN